MGALCCSTPCKEAIGSTPQGNGLRVTDGNVVRTPEQRRGRATTEPGDPPTRA